MPYQPAPVIVESAKPKRSGLGGLGMGAVGLGAYFLSLHDKNGTAANLTIAYPKNKVVVCSGVCS